MLFFLLRFFFLGDDLIGAAVRGSFQAWTIYIPAAPDVQRQSHCSSGLGGDEAGWSGEGALGQHIACERVTVLSAQSNSS